jgi:curved DNA-binding protein CbpA
MSLNGADPYAILGVPQDATGEQIRRAFRTLMRQHHPDTRPAGDPTQGTDPNTTLEQAIAAYAILGDPASRAAYDHRSTAQHPKPTPRGGPAVRPSAGTPGQPPIQAGPVRWHHPSRESRSRPA